MLLLGYGAFGFFPGFSAIYLLKVLEASVNYSIYGTAKHALFLPLNPIDTCHAKMTIDTLFWRFGDLLQALTIFVGLHILNFTTQSFVYVNIALALIAVLLAKAIATRYRFALRRGTGHENTVLPVGACGQDRIVDKTCQPGRPDRPPQERYPLSVPHLHSRFIPIHRLEQVRESADHHEQESGSGLV